MIASPGFPNQSYPNNLNCMWTITARPGFSVQLTFDDFETEQSFDIVSVSGSSERYAMQFRSNTSLQNQNKISEHKI